MPMSLKEIRQRRQFGERAAAKRARAATKRRLRQRFELSRDAAHLLVTVPPIVLAAWREVRP